ncbi:MAG: GTP diphosphokinase [Candidatus Arsenophonus melophagi]|nr:GTP diphosphokinase [Candidatus Arsenophonus melophagi]
MVAIRSAHLTSADDFAIGKWVANLQLINNDSEKKLIKLWNYCYRKVQHYENYQLLLGRGIEMGEILSTLSMDLDSLCAAMLFPLVDANIINEEIVNIEFGKTIHSLVKGVIDMDAIRQLNTNQLNEKNSNQVDNIRRMLLAIAEDFRCVVIKITERLTYLREVREHSENKRVLAAKECINIYAPLANRLGIGQLKWELEDFCFHYLHQDEYKKIAKLLDERRIDREQYIDNFVSVLRNFMLQESITSEIYGRPKHIYSIWRKMQKKYLTFNELFDIRAVRIVVEHLQDCYAALGIVHMHFRHLPNEFDDYVANPKPNGYQSIHTVVLGPHGKTIEVQIRTRQMHKNSELGVAAHWKYKEGVVIAAKESSYENRIIWIRKLIAWKEELADEEEIFDEISSQVFDDRIYVFTPKGDVIELLSGSTPLDFAYHIHSDVGHHCIGAKVNGRIAPFNYHLQMGDQVEIITQKSSHPSRDWLNVNLGYVTTNRSRTKINNWFRKQDRDKNIQIGRQILANELNHLAVSIKEVEKFLLTRYNVNSLDEILAGIGIGDIRINQLINFLQNKFSHTTAQESNRTVLKSLEEKISTTHCPVNKKSRLLIEGVGNLMYYIARCCQPIPGDSIAGFIAKGRGISIHRINCDQLIELQLHAPERIVGAVWRTHCSRSYLLNLHIMAHDRSGLLRDITTVLTNAKVNVLGISSHSDTKQQLATIDMNIEIYTLPDLGHIFAKLNRLPDVFEVKRHIKS